MPARSGREYVESIRKQVASVYLGGRRITDVTAEPVFQEPIRAIAEQYDMQLDPAYRDVMTYPRPPPASRSPPRSWSPARARS